MSTSHTCPKCGALLPADAPEGLCPACLMIGGLPSEAATVRMTPTQKPGRSDPTPTPSPEELAPYFPQLEILELLGRGGMGMVYKARQKNLNRIVALKILPVDPGADEQFAERFQREAQALAKLNHPNIVSVFDFGEAKKDDGPGLFYFLMEFVDGTNLRTLIRTGEMKPEAALALIPAFCDALQFAHDEGVVHRDIKPENVLVDKKGRVKIADFGLAKLLGHESADHTLTRTGMYLGTPRYMAPEQMDKPETVDHRADIYSLGVVFYEMLTGEVPMGRFEPPSKKVQIDVKLDEIVLHAMERDVERRYQHVSEIKSDVEDVSRIVEKLPLSPGTSSSGRSDGAGDADPAVVEPVTTATTPERLKLWTAAFSVLLLSWLLPAILWNFRSPGCLAAVLLMGGIYMALAWRRMQRVPVLAQSWNQLRRVPRCANLAAGVLLAALGFFFLFGAIENRWEARPINWNSAGTKSEEFTAAHKGQEYKLIRQLGAFKDQVPAVELFPNGGTWTGGWNVFGIFGTGGPHNRLFDWTSVMASLVMAFICLAQVVQFPIASWRLREWFHAPQLTAARCALPLAVAALFSGFCAYVMLVLLQSFSLQGPQQWLDRASLSVRIDSARTMDEFKKWAAGEGYAMGDESKWDLDAVPKGGKLGEVRLSQAWKPSPFDRWRMTGHGFERVSPHVVLETISSEKPVETLARIHIGRPPKDPQLRDAWKTLLDSLESTIKAAGGQGADGAVGNAISANTVTQAPSASEILRKMEEKYASLSSFSATGRVVSGMVPAGGAPVFSTEHMFTIKLARPDFYRIEWTQKMNAISAGFTMQGAVWSSGDGPSLLMPGGKVSKLLNREQALAMATGISGGAAHRVPGLFFKEKALEWLHALKNPSRQPDEKIDDEDCHVISADHRSANDVLWITKKSSLLKQIRSTAGGADVSGAVSQAVSETSDANLKKMLKITGQEVTPEAIAAMRKNLQSAEKLGGQFRSTITQTFQRIVVDELMEREDFEYSPPPTVVAPATSDSPAPAVAPFAMPNVPPAPAVAPSPMPKAPPAPVVPPPATTPKSP